MRTSTSIESTKTRACRPLVALAAAALLGLIGVVSAPAVLAQSPPEQRNFIATLSGDEEVPPVITDARGQAKFQISRDGTELDYRLTVSRIENVTQAHIHCAAAGVNGPVVAFLYPDSPPAELIPGRTDGVLAEGTISGAEVIARPDSPECPGGVSSFSDLVDKIRSGQAYVNVHTSQFPGGEIRGQLR